MSKAKKIAEEILKNYPESNMVILTEDGQGFFVELDATRHHQRNGFKQEPEVFFREGFEPEDTKELEEDLCHTKEANASLEDAIKQVIEVTNLEATAPEVDGQTLEVVAKVVGLREKLETSQSTFKEVAEAVTRACDLENEVPEMNLSEDALPIVKNVIELRALLSSVTNELASLKASPIEVVATPKKAKTDAEEAPKK